MLFQVALNYGGRTEIVDVCRSVAADVLEGRLSTEDIDSDILGARLYSPDVPDPDLLIRTSGEYRVSNFLLWEIAYTELYITDVLWPEFRLRHLLEAVIDFQSRERRFGGLKGEAK
jgi:undecaprenyl diphosphate synthase